jgi:hypothetical protein
METLKSLLLFTMIAVILIGLRAAFYGLKTYRQVK